MAGSPSGRKVVIGLDVGTTAAKVSAFALGDDWRASAVNEYPLLQPQPGWEVQDPEVIWRALREGLAEVAAECGDAQVVGIGASLGGPTGYAINPARDLGPRIAHFLLPIAGKGDSDWSYSWIPVVGPIIGGVLAGLCSMVLLP